MYQEFEAIGNIGKGGVELRYSPEGKAVAHFSLAIDEKRGDKKTTLWVSVSVWGNQAEACNNYLKQGSKVFIKGRLTYDEATGRPRLWKRQDGTEGASFEVSANVVRFLSGKADGEGQPQDSEPF